MVLYVTFAMVMLAAAALLAIGVAWLMAYALIHPPRMTDGKALWVLKRLSPEDLRLEYEPLPMDVRDDATGKPLRLAAWWIPQANAAGRTVVLIHGYADAKVGAIAWAPMLHDLGWNILAIDLRAHGQSQGAFTTAGYLERHDIAQLVDQLRAERPADAQRIVLYGLSLGAAVAAAAAEMRNDLAGVILDSPAASEQSAIMAQFDLMGMPGPALQRLAMRMARWMTGADLASIRPARIIANIPAPLLLISGEDDPFLTMKDAADLAEAMEKRRQMGRVSHYWQVPRTGHLLAMPNTPEEYRQRVGEFLARC